MKNTLRFALIALPLASLSTACRSDPTTTAPEPIEVKAEESSFRLFTTASTPSSRAGGEVQTQATHLHAMGEPIASHPRHRASFEPRPSLRTQLRQSTIAGFNVTDEASLRAVVSALRNMTGLPLIVHPRAEDAVLDAGIVFDFDLENEIGAVALLNLIADAADDEISWVIRHDAILFTVESDARGPVVVHAHDIRGITSPRTDFSGPRIGQLRLLGEDDGAFGGAEQVATITEEEVLSVVQENIAQQTWDQDGVSIDAQNGMLIVVHSLEVQLKVARFLESIS